MDEGTYFAAEDPYNGHALWRRTDDEDFPVCVITKHEAGKEAWALVLKGAGVSEQ